MDHSGGIIARVFTGERIADRLTQVAILIAAAHALMDGGLQIAAGQARLLAQFYPYDGHAGILADGQVFTPGELGIFDQLPQQRAAQRLGLLLARPLQGGHGVRRQRAAGVDTQLAHLIGNLLCSYRTHKSLLGIKRI